MQICQKRILKKKKTKIKNCFLKKNYKKDPDQRNYIKRKN